MREKIIEIVVFVVLFGLIGLVIIDDWNNPAREYIYECETVQGEKIYCEYVHEPTRRTPLLYGETKEGVTVQITSYRKVEVEK